MADEAQRSHNPRGGDKSVHMKARMWDRLMTDAALHGGLRSLLFGDGTLVMYDPALTPQEADGVYPEWLTGHPAVTEYPLKPAHDHRTVAGNTGGRVYRLPGTHNTEAQGYDPISLRPFTKARQHPCELCGDEPAMRYRYERAGDRTAVTWLCALHADSIAVQTIDNGGTFVRADQLGPAR